MDDLFQVFIDNILPIFVIAAMGYGLRVGLHLDKKVLSRAAFFALSPSLIFSLLVNSTLPGSEFLLLAFYALIVTILFGVMGFVVGKLFRLPRADTVALMLVLMFTNAGNYGLTLNEIRFGNEGLERAIVYFVMSGMLVSTLGVFLASMGRTSARESFKQMIRLPAFYSVLLAIIVRYFSLTIPSPLMRGIELAGSGAIPVMLLVLGMQIADLKNLERVSLAVPATLLRLLVGPVIAVLVAGLVGLQGLNRTVSVVEASMPTAVYTTILATEYEIRPGFVTSTVTLSTLLSAITLPVVITLLKM